MTEPARKPRRAPNWEYPRRLIASRWREHGITWVLLECDHIEPATGLDLATSLYCHQCNPIPRGTPVPLEDWT